MGDVLSQSEIDNLLNALSSGELDVDEIKENSEQQVKDYDFARPSKFSKEHLRSFLNITAVFLPPIFRFISGKQFRWK